MDVKKILVPVLVLLVGLVLGFIVGQPMGQRAGYQLARQEVAAELQQLREIVEEFWPTQPEMLSISGQALEVKPNSLLIETAQIHPLEKLPVMREVLVTAETVIVRRTEKDPEVYEREMEEYMRLEEEMMDQIEAGVGPEEWPPFPEPYLENQVALNQVEKGNRIWVEAGQDIKWAESFTAVKIIVDF